MTEEIIKTIKTQLIERKKDLEKELAQFTSKNVHIKDDFSADFPEFGDKEDENAAEVATFSDNLSLEQTLEKSLRDVNAALTRIEKGAYGTCKYCGDEIEEKRLVARPVSSACVKCKEKKLSQI
jgi:DnaK suppressor protein